MQTRNTTLDDLSAVIGFTATARLASWFGGRNLYVPLRAKSGDLLPDLIGMAATKRLVDEFGGDWLAMPSLAIALRDSRYAMLCRRMQEGEPLMSIAEDVKMSRRRLEQLRVEFRSLGLLIETEETRAKSRGQIEGGDPT